MNYIDKLIQICKDLLRLCKQLKKENEELSRDLVYYKEQYENEKLMRMQAEIRN